MRRLCAGDGLPAAPSLGPADATGTIGPGMTKAELLQIVDELPENAVDGASVLLKRVALGQLDPGQAWAWSPEWQAKLEASLLDVQTGRVAHYSSNEEFLGAL